MGVVSDVAMVILSAAVGALAGVVTTVWKSRKDLEAQYDIDLRKRRIEAYAELWKLLEHLADYFEPGAVTHQSARKLGESLRRWYFRTGGLVLSSETRPAYFNLQQALEGMAVPVDGPRDPEERRELEQRRIEILKALASRLRTSSTRDVATRLGPRLGPSFAARLSGPFHRLFAPVRVIVDRRWEWEKGLPEAAFFVIVENLTDREIDVAGVQLPGTGELVSKFGEREFRLQPGEDRELGAVIPPTVDGPIAPQVTVRVRGRWQLKAHGTPGVPLQSHLIVRADSEPESGGESGSS